ncbi:hypothetical protein [Microbacterium sp. NPDC056736]|uniref:hypothetical protein n=1 Tax=Microbacterium sp. NPDC056736 TaxID=3345932 RepID=UPI00366BAC50
MNDEIAVALIAGLSALAAAVVGLVGVLAPRSEPRAAKELLALNTILETFPAGEARESLEARRTRVAATYGAQREPMGVFGAAYLLTVGGFLLAIVAILILGGDAGAWVSLFQSLLIGLALGGLLLSLVGIALLVAGLGYRIRDWWRARVSTEPSDAAPAAGPGSAELTLP